MITLAYYWQLDLIGRFHPLLVHFPIGLLIGALMMECWSRLRKEGPNYSGMVYLGAFGAALSAIMGAMLKASGNYEGDLVDQHQLVGYFTAGLSLATAFLYWRRERLPAHLPFIGLITSCLSVSLAGHMGASITHGEDYLTSAMPWNQREKIDPDLLQTFHGYSAADSFPQDQLDRLSLEIRATFAHNCNKCHSTAKRKGGLALDHKKGIFAGGDNGPVFASGSAGDSEMMRRLLLPRTHDESMPPEGRILPEEEIELIQLWIDHGAHWLDDSLEIFREAELALRQPALPKSRAEYDHPIDRFVNNYFQEQGISWPQIIDDRRFIRRAYLDITGLLPPSEAVQNFITDKASGKRNDLIKRLFTDKENYVLHWLSFWNDLLRNDYSGTGFITGGRKQITEWLYQSLLEGKPYNQMTAELIDPQPESEGFIKGIKWRGVVNASQRTELQAAQNISQSLLGVNLKCTSCHNSFVNNLTLDEAYGFANIFAETPIEIYRCDKSTGRMATTSFLYPELGQVDADSLKERLRQLAKTIVQPANGRLYRTVVNRFWDCLFGRGIVAPVDEMDNVPWSQDLLDWLAFDFIKNGYDLRQLLLQIMTSKAYQLPAVAYPSPEYLASPKFVFRGPTVRSLTAEQFADAFGQILTPMYPGVAFDPSGRQIDAEWIWHEEIELDRRVLPKPGTRFFRKAFSLDQVPPITAAKVLITADEAFTLYVNGKMVSEGMDWRKVHRLELPSDLLYEENIIAVVGVNGGAIPNPAGLLFSLRLQYPDGTHQVVYSDSSWTTSDTMIEQWNELSFDDKSWKPAWTSGALEKSYWGSLLDFTYEPDSVSLPFARASLVRLDNFMKTLSRPVRENVTTQRNRQVTLLQSLMMNNSAFLHENIARAASKWMEKMGHNPEGMLDQLYLETMGRGPTPEEKKLLLTQLDTEGKLEALEDIIWAIIMLPEFQLI